MCDFRICSESALDIIFEVYLTTSACRGVSSCGAVGEPAKDHLRLSQGWNLTLQTFQGYPGIGKLLNKPEVVAESTALLKGLREHLVLLDIVVGHRPEDVLLSDAIGKP